MTLPRLLQRLLHPLEASRAAAVEGALAPPCPTCMGQAWVQVLLRDAAKVRSPDGSLWTRCPTCQSRWHLIGLPRTPR